MSPKIPDGGDLRTSEGWRIFFGSFSGQGLKMKLFAKFQNFGILCKAKPPIDWTIRTLASTEYRLQTANVEQLKFSNLAIIRGNSFIFKHSTECVKKAARSVSALY